MPFDPSDRIEFEGLLALDHMSFPWLWWNSADEFLEYPAHPVSDRCRRDDTGRVVAYTGTTRFRTWGHLDRIAVAPDLAGAWAGQGGARLGP